MNKLNLRICIGSHISFQSNKKEINDIKSILELNKIKPEDYAFGLVNMMDIVYIRCSFNKMKKLSQALNLRMGSIEMFITDKVTE